MILVGCATSREYVPRHATIDPGKGISVPHPVELEKQGIKQIVTFQGLLDPGLWVEVVSAGGVWPFLAQTVSGEILEGYAYLAGLNYWGDWQLEFTSKHSFEELKEAKILYFNRDAGFCYQLNGNQVKYDPKKFDDDEEYRTKLFSDSGWTLEELNPFWLGYLKEKGLGSFEGFNSVVEVKVGSPEWNDYKSKVSQIMPFNYKMADGEIRSGYLPLESFRQAAVEIPGFNGVDRYLKRAKVPIFFFPFAGVGLLVTAGAMVAGDAVAATANDSWTGSYARAQAIRYQLAPLFRQICLIYRELLEKRDQRIEGLIRRLIELETKMVFQK